MANISENAQDLLNKRYLRKDYDEKTWEDICCRVADAIADGEEGEFLRTKWFGEFYNLMINMDFIPSTPVLLNADAENPGQLSSCFIIDIRDNIESIYQAKAECAKIFQKNGGVGFNISALRPSESDVETSKGYAGGPIDFMEEFDLTADIVTRHNIRKGAMKIDLACWHPDIFKFIHCKDDINKLQHMNISVSTTNKFMNAVLEDQEWQLKFPDFSWNKEIYNNEWNGNIDEWELKGYPVKIYQTIKAKDLYKEINVSAWKTGEPGISMIDNMDQKNTNPHLGHIAGSNPCLHKDSYIQTENGLEKISKLKSRIWNGYNYNQTKTWKTGIKQVVRIMTNSGFEYITTPDHKFLLDNDEWCEAKDLIGKQIKFDFSEKEWIGANPYPQVNYQILGFELGDGCFHKASNRMKYIYATPDKDQQIIDLIENEFNDSFYPQGGKLTVNIPNDTIYADAFSNKIERRMIPDWMLTLPKKEMSYFLKGLFSANGCNLKKYHKIQLVSINKEMLQQIQQMLLLFGIKAKLWYHNKQHDVSFINGVYTCKQSCHLVISRESYYKFLDDIGFIQDYKNGYEKTTLIKKEDNFETVILISELDEVEVWDFTESQYHQGITNGAYVHNCAEFVNIPYSSCNLGSGNLANFGNSKEEVLETLKRIIPKAVRFIDNMITVNKLPLEKIDKVTKAIRPIGLGTFGLADLLYKLKIPYNSDEGYKFIDILYEELFNQAKLASCKLAEEKGVYPEWKGSKWEQENIKIRNSNLLSIAPTGSISFLANASGGLEPNYALVMQRRTNTGDLYYIINSIFEQELKTKGLYSQELIEKIFKNNGSVKGLKEIPADMQKIFVTAYDITPEEHLKVLSIIQSHVDLSCSKTINLPNKTTVEEIMDLYLSAWKLGIKGITVYRDGCRNNQVLTTGSSAPKNNEIKVGQYIKPKKRPKITKAEIEEFQVGCGKLYITVGEVNNQPFETFTNLGNAGVCPGFSAGLSRMVSLALRSGIDPDDVIDQLTSVTCANCRGKKTDAKSCPDAYGKALKRKFKKQAKEQKIVNEADETVAIIKNDFALCPECGAKLNFSEGCVSCTSCGFSKCS